jgi:nitric oxide reductase NorD protein
MASQSRQNLLYRIRIQKDLEEITGPALSRHSNLDAIISKIANLSDQQQAFIYQWARLIADSNAELAAHFISFVPKAFDSMIDADVQRWIDLFLKSYDNYGLGKAIISLEDIDGFADEQKNRGVRCSLQQTNLFLQHFIRGLGGRELKIASHDETYTNTEGLFLPESISIFPQPKQNFTLYKLTAAHLWAQTWYGTWRIQVLEKLTAEYNDQKSLDIFNRLECIRLNHCIARDFPGLNREFSEFERRDADVVTLWQLWRDRVGHLSNPTSTGIDTIKSINHFRDVDLPALQPYQGEIFLDRIRETMLARIEQEQIAFQQSLDKLRDENAPKNKTEDDDFVPKQMLEVSEGDGSDGEPSETNFQLTLDGQPIEFSDDLKNLAGSIMQDFGEIPDQYMEPLEQGEYSDALQAQHGESESDPNPDLNETGTFQYHEWDCTRQRFREDFCTLRELVVPPGNESFISETLEKYRGALRTIKKCFEAVLGESRPQRRQPEGDDIDLDAVVNAHIDLAQGKDISHHLYTNYRNQERNVAVMFMVDMSGSTLGWVNNAERESLVLLCEALELLGDRYAIYGFSGRTNKRCEVYSIKNFKENYSLGVRQRISGIRPKAYTRMGVAIRHLGQMLQKTHARTKLLITLSDGRPEDYGGYKGQYGIEDTRHALLEMKQSGVHAFCITIDNEAQEYLPHMYGTANYAVIDEVKKLPLKVADIYRRLTT